MTADSQFSPIADPISDPLTDALSQKWLRYHQSLLSPQIAYPRITVVTPSYNQGQYLEQTIRSVLWQGYPNLEFIIIDGGSTDNSVEIIQNYASHLTSWVSEPDHGQSHAINKGFSRCTGDILAWLNSDDLYTPGTLHQIAQLFTQNPKADLLTGAWIGYEQAYDRFFCTRACGVGLHPTMAVMLAQRAYLGQHSTFWRRQVWEAAGPVGEHLYYAMDHDFFLRCCDQGFSFKLTHLPLAVFRLHAAQKTSAFDQYTAESETCMQQYENRPEWRSPLGQFKIRLAQHLIALGHHRNQHPRLGLIPRYNQQQIRTWLTDLQG